MPKLNRSITAAVAGLLAISAAALFFYWHVGRGNSISSLGANWGEFGDYFGGVAGTLLAFVSIILLVYTIHQQNEQIENAQEDARKRDLLLYISKADEEIDRWLQRRLHANNSPSDVPLADLIWGGVSDAYVNPIEFKSSIRRLHQLTGHFCLAIALYRDNINGHYVFRHYRDKGMDLIRFIEGQQQHLTQEEWMGLSGMKSLIKFEHEA